MEKDDKKLIEDFLDGDTQAFALLVEHNIKLVYRYVFRMTKNTEDAEDITQETFVKIWRNLHKFDFDKNFRTWILGIAHNTAIDTLRKRKSFAFSDFEIPDGADSISDTIADTAPLPPEIFARAEQRKLLDSALAQISPLYREILMLSLEEELTFNEIGIIFNKPLNTVKSQYRRALMTLRKILESSAQ